MIVMSFTKESAVARSVADLSKRLDIPESDVQTLSVSTEDFPDMSLGLPADGEFAAQMIATGWLIRLEANGDIYEYRADKYQIRLKGFDGNNQIIAG